MTLFPRLALLSLAFGLTACTILESDKIDYKSASKAPSLAVPPDLTQLSRDNRYAIPGGGPVTASSYQLGQSSSSVPVAVATLSDVRVERAGNQRWLVVKRPADQLWEPIKDFWQESGFLLALDQSNLGIMETDWAENRAKIPQDFIRSSIGKLMDSVYSTAERDKFRTRLERHDDGGTEIYISHRGMIEVDKAGADTKWQPRPPDPDLEAEFLRRLMVRLGTQEEKSKQLVATATQAPARAAVQAGIGGFETLEVFEPFDRTWRRVGLALDRVGFTVEDRDRQKGQYFVRYADTDAGTAKKSDDGVLSKLQFWKSSDPTVKAEQYRVHIRQFAGKCVVQILTKDGAQANTQTTRRIVALLYDQLK